MSDGAFQHCDLRMLKRKNRLALPLAGVVPLQWWFRKRSNSSVPTS
jgi:hypothetical protein